MHEFEVWAPAARRVDAVVDGDLLPLAPALRRGWWTVTVDGAGPGSDYQFSVDGGPSRPDPRSSYQPEGPEGPSRVISHDAYVWTDDAWRGVPLGAVTYELHTGTFSPEGTFDGAVSRLDHLVQLGVGAIELMPVAQFGGDRGWGYDGVNLFAPHAAYGGPDGLKRLVDACHARGLAVIVDAVYNHLGPSGNFLHEFGPYFTDRYSTPWGRAVNFDDRGSDEVRRFVIDNALMWLRDYHCDGLRLDAVHAIHDESAEHILAELARSVRTLEAQLERTLFVIAESDLNDPRVIEPPEIGGHGIDAQWSDDFHHALHAVLTAESTGYYADFGSLAQLARSLEQGFVFAGDYSPYRDRRHGRALRPGTPGTRLLGYLQNHDQVGNRATGDRSSHLLSTERLKIGAALVFCSPFVPMLFQGEEWGASAPFQYFTDHPDPELGSAVREGRRREFAAFGWSPDDVPDPQDPATFERSKLNWDELEKPSHAELLDWHRQLISLRRDLPELSDGSFEAVDVAYDDDQRWLVMRRGDPGVVVAVNAGSREVSVPLRRSCTEVLLGTEGCSLRGDAADLPPDSVLICR